MARKQTYRSKYINQQVEEGNVPENFVRKERIPLDPIIQFPWFENINECIKSSNLIYKKIDKSQLDERT